MPLKQFEYFAPRTIEEATTFLSRHPEDARPLAGGQSLVPLMKLDLIEVRYLVDLKTIPGLTSISIEKGDGEGSRIIIGSLANHSDISQSEVIKKYSPLLARTARGIGHPLVRNRGTIGGSVCHCDPSGDYCATLLALDAEMSIASSSLKRNVRAEDFFLGPFTTVVNKDEILEQISVPLIEDRKIGYSIKKLSMGHGSFPLVVVSVAIGTVDRVCNYVRIAFAGVADKPFRAKEAEIAILDSAKRSDHIDETNLDEFARIAMEACTPSSDLDVSAEYKKRMAKVLARRALKEAFEGCR